MREWNNMQYAASAAFLLAVYSDYLSNAHAVLKCPVAQVQPQDLLNFAQSQVLILYILSFSLYNILPSCYIISSNDKLGPRLVTRKDGKRWKINFPVVVC